MSTKSGLEPKKFESIVDGKPTALYVLNNKLGHEICVTNFGGVVLSVMMPDREGNLANVVLGQDSIERLLNNPEPYLGAAIGRYGNRIAKGQFTLDGVTYQATVNDGTNSLHGGKKGFNFVVWDAEQIDGQTVVMRYTSKDGEEGFPGNLSIEMTYRFTDADELRIDYTATTDKLTICNLTNHSFFNLSGIAKVTPSVEPFQLQLNCDRYIPVDAIAIPLGQKAPVEGTPFDFRTPHIVGERINNTENEQIKNGRGYDHSFCVSADAPLYTGENPVEGLREVATCTDLKSGRYVKTFTTEPGMQLYTGNFLSGVEGNGGCTFPFRSGICFEPQHHPDSPNQEGFEKPYLAPGETYRQTSIYAFGVAK